MSKTALARERVWVRPWMNKRFKANGRRKPQRLHRPAAPPQSLHSWFLPRVVEFGIRPAPNAKPLELRFGTRTVGQRMAFGE